MRKYNNVARLRHFCGLKGLGTIFGGFGSWCFLVTFCGG
jgi:hypothetical protein